jgi:hypothetical protein
MVAVISRPTAGFVIRTVVIAACVFVAGCGRTPDQPAQPPARPSPAPVPAAAIERVVVSTATGLGTGFTIGQTIQLGATAEYSDGRRESCTTAAAWLSTNDTVVRPMGRPGEVSMIAFGEAAVMATCGGVTGTLPLSVTRGVRIEGLEDQEPFALTTMDQQLRAYLVDRPGSAEECTEEGRWTTADARIAEVSPHDPGWIWLRGEGQTIVTVTCEGASGSMAVRVGYYDIDLTIVDAVTGAPVAGAAVNASNVRTDASGRHRARGNELVEEFTLWRLGYDLLSRVQVTWDRRPGMSATYAMSPVSGIFLRGTASLCGNERRDCGPGQAPREQVHGFQVPYDGTLRVDAIWVPGGLYDTLSYELTCNEAVVRQGLEHGSVRGRWFEAPASASCDYALRIRQSYNGTDTYEFAISVR